MLICIDAHELALSSDPSKVLPADSADSRWGEQELLEVNSRFTITHDVVPECFQADPNARFDRLGAEGWCCVPLITLSILSEGCSLEWATNEVKIACPGVTPA